MRQSDENHRWITSRTTFVEIDGNKWKSEWVSSMETFTDENAIAINNNKKKEEKDEDEDERSEWFDCIRVKTTNRLHEHAQQL